MQPQRALNLSTLFLHLAFATGMLFLNAVGDQREPLSLALAFAMGAAGLSPVFTFLSYFLIQCLSANTVSVILSLGQAVLMSAAFELSRRFFKNAASKREFIRLFALAAALCLYVVFTPFTAYQLPFSVSVFTSNVAQKAFIAGIVFVLANVFSVAVKALLYKLLKCRLQDSELLFLTFLFVLCGVGVSKLLGLNAYLGVSFFLLLLFSYVTKDALIFVCAFLLSLPAFLVYQLSISRFFIYGTVVTLFTKSGRVPTALSLLCVYFAFAYIDGIYTYPTDALYLTLLSALLPTLFYLLLPTSLLRKMENKFVFYREKHLSRIAINRNRAAVGKQLYELSDVFKEVENTFAALGTTDAEDGAKEYMRADVIASVCKTCHNQAACRQNEVFNAFPKLLEVGCLKSKVSLVDLPTALADHCVRQSDVLYAVNQRLSEYRTYMLETENAASGRALLARQAQGVSEILRNLALEQSEPMKPYTERERALSVALQKIGVVCSEVMLYGEETELTLSMITFGRADAKKIAAVASNVLQTPMMVAEKIFLSGEKFCYVLKRKPRFDAAFGVATQRKYGETASGDTHALVKIDERRFLVALSDGMGSGEYAKRISESTITLLESFYRAKMPSDTVLSTINKLLTFSKEETFACVDIAVVDLDSGEADFVKIGSPVAFILSGNTVKVLESTSLPLGILDCLHPDAASYTLQENDTLLFLSDGITTAFGSTADLYDALKNIPLKNPQQLADALLEEALTRYGRVAKDDMTAIAVRLFACTA